MTEQVERKKSYRWVSAGQASYDGADWNSTDDSSGEEATNKSSVKRGDTVSKLPALPKLNYNQEEDSEDERAEDGSLNDNERKEQFSISQTIKPQSLVVEDQDGSPITWESPGLGASLSRDSSKSSVQVRRTPVNEDLENLMVQIVKEMTPKVGQSEEFGEEEHSGEPKSYSAVSLERASLNSSRSEDELQVSKDGYFSKFIQRKDEDDYMSDDGASSHSPVEETCPTPSVAETNNKQGEDGLAHSFDEEAVTAQGGKDEEVSAVIEDSRSLQPSSDEDAYLSSEEGDEDALSYTDSINYQAARSQSAGKQDVDSEGVIIPREDEDSDGLDEEIRVSKSGYFNKMVQSDSDASANEQDSLDDDDERTIPETINSSDTSQIGKAANEAIPAASRQDENEPDENEPVENESVENESVETKPAEDEESRASQLIASNHQQGGLKGTDEVTTNGQNIEDGDEPERDGSENEVGETPEKELSSTRQSINMGKWKPDMSAFRNDFVQETTNNPPPGFVYDETGNLVDLTPSSMKPRVVSTYSEVESSWNAFPSEGNDDLETVRDTKTLYDNNTIHNVPGIIGNNQNLPPLPSITSGVNSTESSDEPRSLGTGTSTTLTLDGENRRGPLQTHFKEVFTVPAPDTKDIAKVTGEKTVPSWNINKIVSSKTSHADKIEQLRAYSKQLKDYDTGIQTWLGYTLKSSSKTDRDFIFDEYKVSTHVRDAYAHADELSKKHTVSNTVANVNQNVSHLTKKVFAHSKKSRGLFSSIGKKRV
ncbi:hypothetical protein HG536_0E04950 [Torulaspora globosa]|uniref:Protein FYV8 n=1 Tax=Torulaspora globosa TaxID=48254 RepID=A0A7G3ZJ98_9SACH|nr:uncharacterized protein HG536_0E04950 [Torulaspora globosa]QLL33584.1 hypothetical protein HG536_0E04950 [Torulaspora globosa]